MRNFKNNLRKNKFRNGSDRGFTRNSSTKLNGDFVNNDNFRRKNPGKNNHNASKLIEKYNDLAREALSKGNIGYGLVFTCQFRVDDVHH